MCDLCVNPGLSRRGLLLGAASVAGAAVAASTIGAAPAFAQGPANPAEAIKALEEGNGRYLSGVSINRDYSVERAVRAAGQAPFAAIVACADSRVPPEIIFDQGPGDLFVVRVAGNFITKENLASLEFGAAVLGTQAILVLGHTSCGAVEAAIDVVKNKTELPGHLQSLATAIAPAVEKAIAGNPTDLLAAATIENVKLNVAYLKAADPILSDLVAKGKLDVVGGVYDLATGKIDMV